LKFVVLLVLAALWAVVLVPPLLRARAGRSSDSIGDFNYRLGVLSRTNGSPMRRRSRQQLPVLSPPVAIAAGVAPYRMTAAQRSAKRRRDITLGLAVAAVLTLAIAAVAHSTSVWALQVLVDLLLVGYLALVAWTRSPQSGFQASMQPSRMASPNVRYLATHRAPELALQPSEYVLRRTASS
jgi:hypothetical protein